MVSSLPAKKRCCHEELEQTKNLDKSLERSHRFSAPKVVEMHALADRRLDELCIHKASAKLIINLSAEHTDTPGRSGTRPRGRRTVLLDARVASLLGQAQRNFLYLLDGKAASMATRRENEFDREALLAPIRIAGD